MQQHTNLPIMAEADHMALKKNAARRLKSFNGSTTLFAKAIWTPCVPLSMILS
jgi:hypothetical protein